MNHSVDKIFRRSELGDSEIRQSTLQLSKMERVVLVSITGEVSYSQLHELFESNEISDFDVAMNGLLKKGLIKSKATQRVSAVDLSNAKIAEFDSEEFFSSSLDSMNNGSGIVVDTRNNTMRSVNAKKRGRKKPIEVDLFLPLEMDEKKSRKQKGGGVRERLVEVYPEPEKRVKRKRRKSVAENSESKWGSRIYLGLMGLGLFLVLVAILIR